MPAAQGADDMGVDAETAEAEEVRTRSHVISDIKSKNRQC
jgi:hypothetical protein